MAEQLEFDFDTEPVCEGSCDFECGVCHELYCRMCNETCPYCGAEERFDDPQ